MKVRSVCVLLSCLFLGTLLVLGCSKESKIERHWTRGEKYFSENKYREAVIEYKNVLQADPKNAKAYYKLGVSYLRLGQVREAFSELSKSIDIDPDFSDALLQRGFLYLLTGEPLKAREDANQVLRKDPNNALAHFLMSSFYQRQKNIDQAIAEGNKAIKLDPKKTEFYLNQANLHLLRGDQLQTEELLKEAVKLEDKTPVAR